MPDANLARALLAVAILAADKFYLISRLRHTEFYVFASCRFIRLGRTFRQTSKFILPFKAQKA